MVGLTSSVPMDCGGHQMGEAGFGAEEQVTRKARRVEQLRAEAARSEGQNESVLNKLKRAERDRAAWQTGAEGERRTAETLESLGGYGWTSLHDLRWPGRQKANIDHIALGPTGIFVIDTKNWSGDVTVTGGVLRQNRYSRSEQTEALGRAVADITALLEPAHRTAVHGVICFVQHDIEPSTAAGGVTVLSRYFLASHLITGEARLTPYEVADIGRYLNETLGAPTAKPPRAPKSQSRSRARQRSQSQRKSPATSTRTSKKSVQLVKGIVLLAVALLIFKVGASLLPGLLAQLAG